MKVVKNGIELVIDKKDKKKYIDVGWKVKQEVKPELTRKRYLKKLSEMKGSDVDVSNGE